MSSPVAVYAPTGHVGGVEQVARDAYEALRSASPGAELHVGPWRIVASRRPSATWMSLTWKTHALVTATHPRLRGPSMLWLHGAELTRDRTRTTSVLRERTLRNTDLLLAVSPLARQLLPPCLRSRVQLVGPPVAVPAHADDLRSQRTDDGVLRLLSVGRAVPRKGHDTALEVAALLAGDRLVHLDVIGPGPDLDRLQRLAATHARPGLTVVVHGAVPAALRDELYAAADVLLFLPRREEGEFEGLGLVVLEAATFGCPSVVLDCGGSRYGVVHGEGGLLLSPDAGTRALAEAVTQVSTSSHARDAARRYAAHFALPAWQQRVRAISAGARPDWQWPSHAEITEECR